jgi:protein-disulfide isomerase
MEENTDIKGTEAKQANITLFISIIAIAILLSALLTNGFGFFHKTTGQVVSEDNKLYIGNSPVLGDINAKVTLYEFSTFSCPFCAVADGKNQPYIDALKYGTPDWEAPIPNVIREYVETGKVKIVFKYYPGHSGGEPAMVVGLALKEQNSSLFWKYKDLAFENQQDANNLTKMESLAEQLGANMTELEADISSGKYLSQLKEDATLGTANGITATPSFIINGEIIKGAQSYPVFKALIESKLKESL